MPLNYLEDCKQRVLRNKTGSDIQIFLFQSLKLDNPELEDGEAIRQVCVKIAKYRKCCDQTGNLVASHKWDLDEVLRI